MFEGKVEINKLEKVLFKMNGKKIAVLGDLMLDQYLWGSADRISAEAPIPVVDIKNREYRLGGAANVVNNIYSMNAEPIVIGLLGCDNYATEMIDILKKMKIKTDFILQDKARHTTLKTRIFSSNHQMLRYDLENREDISQALENKLNYMITMALEKADALIIEDYNKGLLTPKIIKHAIKTARKKQIPITVDPKFNHFFEYIDAVVFKQNFLELQKNLNIEIKDDNDLKNAATELFKRINPEYLVITLGEKGLKIYDKHINETHIPTFAKEVFDVSGAGDTVISVLTLCLTLGLDIKTSAILANHAAGAVCGKKGIHPATIEDVILSAKYYNLMYEKRK
jgi:rfaE bifunctional protein kinase chain/domain